MANISDAYGVIMLTGDWTNEMCAALNKIREHWESWYYNIMVNGEFSPDEPEQSFNANGRWVFQSNVKSLDDWMRSDFLENKILADSYGILVAEMEKRKCGIRFDYTDVESGCLVLYDASDLLEVSEGRLTITESSEHNYEYSWENYFECDYGGEEQFEDLIGGILKKFSIKDNSSDERKKKIEEWAMKNTMPFASAECLDEDQLLQLESLIKA
jgi:hypothetical protein